MSHQNHKADDFVLAEFLPFKLTVLAKAVSDRLASEYSVRFDITVPEWRVLALLSQYVEINAQLVANETPLDKVAVSRAVASLLRKGLIAKTKSENDRRASVLNLTQDGRSVAQRIQKLALAHEADLLAGLSFDNQKKLHHLIDQLLAKFS
ncbi:MAG: MarR family winged helix-turn-helix transcriptional regulator [bacterium]